jgi:hypothetical protein
MTRLAWVLLLLCAACATTACARRPLIAPAVPAAAARPAYDGRLHAAVSTYARVGPNTGYMQIPTGGAAGTTSYRRPSLAELGVTNSVEYGARADFDYGRHRGSFEISNLLLHGDNVLSEDLTSQGRFFPAGTSLNSDSNLSSFCLGYSYLFDIYMGGKDRLELRPGIAFRAVGVHYRTSSSNGLSTNRHYTPTAPQLDLQASWRPRGEGPMRFSAYFSRTLEFQFQDPLQEMEYMELSGRANYDFSSRGSIFVETGFKHILLQDDQPTMQNRILSDFGPWLGIGAELRL